MKTVLVVGAHADDEVLGCGGTIARLSSEGASVHVLLLADGETSRLNEQDGGMAVKIAERRTAAENAANILGCSSTRSCDFPDNRLDSVNLLDVVRVIESAIFELLPDTVFVHHNGDVNIDHRIAHEATLAACRPQVGNPVKKLLFFEVPSSTEWRPAGSGLPFAPNFFCDIEAQMELKRQALSFYASEMRAFPHPRSFEAVNALAQWRGATVGVQAAEAFMLGREIF